MPSTARQRSNSEIYHVMSRGVGRCIIFEDDEDRRAFLRILTKERAEQSVTVHAWCLMDNHYHLLLQGDLPGISKMMKRLNSTYAMVFNQKHGRVGHLFQGRFKSVPVESDEQFLTELRYIHQNPVKEKLCPTCEYAWSSYSGYYDEPWIVDNSLVTSLFDSEEQFCEFHGQLDVVSPCLELGRGRRLFSNEEALVIARAVLVDTRLEEIASRPRAARDEALRVLKAAHLSIRQIERLTGISRSIVERA